MPRNREALRLLLPSKRNQKRQWYCTLPPYSTRRRPGNLPDDQQANAYQPFRSRKFITCATWWRLCHA